MKKKDKTRVWWNSYRITCDQFFRTELTAEEYGILVLIFRKYKFQSFIDDPCVNFHRVQVERYELTLHKHLYGHYKLMFKIINV